MISIRTGFRTSRFWVLVAVAATSTDAQDVAFSRRLLSLAPSFISAADTKPEAVTTASNGEPVLVLFRTSEQGNVIDTRPIGGTRDMQSAAVAAVRGWKFKPPSVSGQPIEMHSALLFEFSITPVTGRIPKPMSAEQLSPVLGMKCLNALIQDNRESSQLCKEQFEAVERNRQSSPLERFTARDEYGLSLLKYAHKPKDAFHQFDAAFQLAKEVLKPTDAEWAYVRWHRAIAEQELGKNSESEADFSAAEDSMQSAIQSIADPKMGAYYRGLFDRILQQHAALLESQNKHDDAQQVLSKSR